MNDLITLDPRNPRPGTIFERNDRDETLVLNPDFTVTVARGTESATYLPDLDQWDELAVLAFETRIGVVPGTLGPVGLRMAENYERDHVASLGHRSSYAA